MLLSELCGRHCAGAVGGRGVGNIFSLGRRWHRRWKGVRLWPFKGVVGGLRQVSAKAPRWWHRAGCRRVVKVVRR